MNEHFDRYAPLTIEERGRTPAAPEAADDADLVCPVPQAWANGVAKGDAPVVFLPRDLNCPGLADQVWPYRDAAGQLLGVALRWNVQGGGKEFRFATMRRDPDGRTRWRLKHLPAPRPLYGLDRLAAAPGAPVVVIEGEKAADAAARVFPDAVATTSPGGANAAGKADWSPLAGRRVLIWPDADEAGARYARDVVSALHGLGCEIEIVDAVALVARLGVTGAAAQGFDAADAASLGRDLAELRALALECASPVRAQASAAAPRDAGPAPTPWPVPTPLPDGLAPVESFSPSFLPDRLSPWAQDIAQRMQCPLDFIGVPALVALGSVIGRKVAMRPQTKTDWFETANLWGCVVGRPGAMKSPAMTEALKPLMRLEAEARKQHEAASRDFEAEEELFKLKKTAAQKVALKKAAGGKLDREDIMGGAPEPPKEKRFVSNDSSYEKLGVMLADNPNGVLVFRDELVALLRTLDREDNAAARGFYLTAWNGTSGYSFDRIIRGGTHIDACCVSLLGSTQPGRLSEYIRPANDGGSADDGLIQRFSLLVWPDQSPEWRNVDRYPDSAARDVAWRVFDRLSELHPDDVGAQRDAFNDLPFLRFDAAAQGLFNEWRADLERRLRADEMTPALESHLAKYCKAIPALALIGHLADCAEGAIGQASLLRALALADYLETHARRAYGAGEDAPMRAAKAILKRIRKGELKDGFSAKDIYRNHWSDLSDRGRAQAGLDLLADFDWLRGEKRDTGGRPTIVYSINPRSAS